MSRFLSSVACPVCHGNGLTTDGRCWRCNGTGSYDRNAETPMDVDREADERARYEDDRA
jgi:DnaJ-class molecular chaperone